MRHGEDWKQPKDNHIFPVVYPAMLTQICRDYSTDSCEYEDDWVYDQYFETPEQVEEYAEAVLPRRNGSIRSLQPPLLPIVAS